MAERIITITHKLGLHARPAALFVKTASDFQSKVNVKNVTTGSDTVDAKSILGVLTLGVAQGHTIVLSADGPDDQAAVDALAGLVENNFGETE